MLFLCTSLIWAQGGATGGMDGTVKDPSGAVVPGVQVKVINQNTGVTERTLTSTKEGYFRATQLPIGTYRLVVTPPSGSNFAKVEATNINVRVTEITTVPVVLSPGQLTTEITVSGIAAQVNTANATTGQTLGANAISNLPLVTRNFFALLTLSSGANTEIFDSSALGRGQVTVNVNGQRPTNNNYQLEGIPANDFNLPVLDNVALPNPDTIQEFKTQTSLYDASTGRNGGGNVQVALKSGTDKWHGDAYEFYRNDKFNANDWFLKQSEIENGLQNRPPRLHQNQFGASLGGPVPLGKNWFVFGNYQGTRETSGASSGTQLSSRVVSLPNDRSAGSLINTFFPGGFTAWGLPANTTLDPVALAILNLPASKCPGFNDGTHCVPSVGTPGFVSGATPGTTPPVLDRGTLERSLPGVYDENEFTISSDKTIGNNDKVSARWFWSNFSTTQPFGGGATLPFARTLPQQNRFAKLGWTHTFSSNTVNDARFGFNRFSFLRKPAEPITAAEIGETRPNLSDFPAMSLYGASSFFTLGTGQNDDRGTFSNGYTWADDLSTTRGKHTLRVGGELDLYQLNRYNNFATRGSVAYSTANAGSIPSLPTADALAAFQNFLLGNVQGTQAESGITQYYFRARDYAVYFQDDFKASSRLTLNLGLRWEFLSTAHDTRGYATNFNFNPFTNPPIQEIHPASFPGSLATPGVPDCTLNDCLYKKALEPRAGFAWDVMGDAKTVVRGGFGIYYNRVSNQALLQTTGGLPFQIAVSATPFSVTPANPTPGLLPASLFPLSTGDVFPTLAGFCGSGGVDPTGIVGSGCTPGQPIFNSSSGNPFSAYVFQPMRNFVPPRTMQYNLTIQREITKGWMWEGGYVGTRGDNLLGPGGMVNPALLCTQLKPCVIPNQIAQNVVVPAGTPFVAKNPDGTISITGSTADNADARVPTQYIGWANDKLNLTRNQGFSTYNSFQTSVIHQFSGGLYFQGAYTFSKCLDNGSGSEVSDELNGLAWWGDQLNPHETRGLCDFDRNHRFTGSWNYELPLGKWFNIANSGIGKIVNGWSVNGVLTWQTGTPFMVADLSANTLSDPFFNNGLYFATYAPGATRQTAFTSTPDCQVGSVQCFINPAAFVVGGVCADPQNNPVSCSSPAAALSGGHVNGNVGRNIFRGPRQSNLDFSLSKATKLTERTQLELQWQVFNLFNHPAFASPQAGPTSQTNAAISGGSFGNYGVIDVSTGDTSIISTANRPRVMQFAVKVSF